MIITDYNNSGLSKNRCDYIQYTTILSETIFRTIICQSCCHKLARQIATTSLSIGQSGKILFAKQILKTYKKWACITKLLGIQANLFLPKILQKAIGI